MAEDTTGHNALALAALVAPYAPTLSAADKAVMAALFNGHDPATCFAGDVSISTFSCALTFGKSTITVTGRKGERLATLIEVGVPSSGAAGKIYEALAQLSCSIDPNEIKQNDGGGVI